MSKAYKITVKIGGLYITYWNQKWYRLGLSYDGTRNFKNCPECKFALSYVTGDSFWSTYSQSRRKIKLDKDI